MTYTDIRKYIEEAFEAGWGVTTEIAYENSPALVDETEWVRLSIISNYAANASLGDKRTLKTGIVVLQIFTPLDKGTGRAYELADLANTILENKRWSDLFTYAGAAQPIGDGKGFYQINLKIPFEANS